MAAWRISVPTPGRDGPPGLSGALLRTRLGLEATPCLAKHPPHCRSRHQFLGWPMVPPVSPTFHLVHTKMFLSPAILTREQVLGRAVGTLLPRMGSVLEGTAPQLAAGLGCSLGLPGFRPSCSLGPGLPTDWLKPGWELPCGLPARPGGAHVASCSSSWAGAPYPPWRDWQAL